jgi:hypothetical protein
MKKIRTLAILFLILINLSCAVNSSGLQTMVQEKINDSEKNNIANLNTEIEIIINKNIELVNECKQEKKSFIPALLYWGWNSEVVCEFSKTTIENEISNIVKNKIKNLELEKSLENKKLIINLNELPTKFKFQDKGNVVIVLVAYAMSGKRYFAPELKEFTGNYKIIDEESKIILEKGFTQSSKLLPQVNNYKSTKKLSWQYIDAYNNELDRFVSLLLQEIKANFEINN